MSGVVSLGTGIAMIRAFDDHKLQQSIKRAFYRALDIGRHKAIDQLRRTKIGAMVQRRGNVQLQLGLSSKKKYSREALSAMRESIIPLIVRRSEMQQRDNFGLRGGLETEGFASLIETGGRTKSHQIKRIREGGYSRRRDTRQKQVNALPPMTFQIGGRWVSTRVVTHPGSRVPRNPFLETGAKAAEDALNQELGRALAESLKTAGL
jgi:hypothetical protein